MTWYLSQKVSGHHLHSRLTGVATSHVSIISDTESAANTTATGNDDDAVKSKTSSQQDSPAPGEILCHFFDFLLFSDF